MIAFLLSLMFGSSIAVALLGLVFSGFAITDSIYGELVAKED